jgi:hypothetical protein
MAKYKKDANRILKKDTNIIIPHNATDGEEITVTKCQFKAGQTVNFVKIQTNKVLSALGLDKVERREYVKVAFNNFKDL